MPFKMAASEITKKKSPIFLNFEFFNFLFEMVAF